MTEHAVFLRNGINPLAALCRLGAAVALAVSLGACSTIGGFFAGEDDEPPEAADSTKSDDKGAPKLSTVPDRPRTQTTPSQRQAISQGLRGDKDNAKYAADVTPVDESADAKLGQRLPGAPAPQPAGGPAAPPAPQPAAAPAPGPVTSAPVAAPGGAAPPPAPVPTAGGYFAGRGSTLEVAVIQFGRGSAALNAEDRAILREVANIQKRNGGTVRVIGHDGDDGAVVSAQGRMAAFNVSQARANAVAAELIRQGVRRDAIQVSAVSDGTAAVPGTQYAAGDRKAEIFIDF